MMFYVISVDRGTYGQNSWNDNTIWHSENTQGNTQEKYTF